MHLDFSATFWIACHAPNLGEFRGISNLPIVNEQLERVIQLAVLGFSFLP
jgi:hypothetical protein